MSDIARVVKMTAGGRPMVQLDLFQANRDVVWLRGTMRLGQRQPAVNFPGASRPRDVPYSGDRTDAATTLTATWRVRGTTAADAIARLERVLAQIDSGHTDRYIEHRPDGHTVSGFHRLVGPGSYNPLYESVQFQGTRGIQVEVTWPVEPWATGLQWDVLEEWQEPVPKPDGYVNEITNPSAALDTRGQFTPLSGLGTVSRDTTWPTNGTSWRVSGTASTSGQFPGFSQGVVNAVPAKGGDAVSARLDYKVADRPGTQTTLQLLLRAWKADGSVQQDLGVTSVTLASDGLSGTWTKENVVLPAGTVSVGIIVQMQTTGADTFDMQMANVALYKATALPTTPDMNPADGLNTTTYADGDTDGWVWEGQPHYSRSLEALEANMAEWTVDTNTARATARNSGELIFLGAGATSVEFRARHTGRNTGPRVNDEVEMVFVASPSPNQMLVTLSASADGNSYLMAGLNSSAQLGIWYVTGGVNATVLNNTAALSYQTGSVYTLRFSRVDNRLDAVLLDRDGTTTLATAGATLAGTQLQTFSRGGDAGLRLTGTTLHTDPKARVLSWKRSPNTWRLTGDLPETLLVANLPGSPQGELGHRMDVSVQPTTQTSEHPFGMLAWARKQGVENLVWNGDFERESTGWAAGGTGADPSPVPAVGGSAGGATVARVVSATSRLGQAVLRITGDGTATFQSGSYRAWKRVKRGVLHTAVVWYRTQAGGQLIPPITSSSVTNQAGGSLAVGAVMRYRVTALNAAGETLPGTEVTGTVLAAPNQTLRVSWTAVTGATGYRVYRSDTGAGNEDEYVQVGAVTSLDDTGALSWTAGTPPATNTANANVGQLAFGYDTTDRTTANMQPFSSAWQMQVVEWTPTADRESIALSVMLSTGNAAVTMDVDGVMIFEGSIPPDDLDAAAGRGGFRPFGKLHALNDWRSLRFTSPTANAWTKAASPDRLSYSVPAGGAAGLAWLGYLLDPFLLDPPEGVRDPLVDVFLHGYLSSGFVNPRIMVQTFPPNVNVPVNEYSQPYGSAGKPLTLPSGGTHERTWYLGKVGLPRDLRARGRIGLYLQFQYDAGSTTGAVYEPEYLVLAPSHGTAGTGTGKKNDATYPKFVPLQTSTMEPGVRVVKSDLSGVLAGAVTGRGVTDSSLGGEHMELPPGGDALVMPWVAMGVPDDPTSDAHDDTDAAGAVVHVAVQPRYNLFAPARA